MCYRLPKSLNNIIELDNIGLDIEIDGTYFYHFVQQTKMEHAIEIALFDNLLELRKKISSLKTLKKINRLPKNKDKKKSKLHQMAERAFDISVTR